MSLPVLVLGHGALNLFLKVSKVNSEAAKLACVESHGLLTTKLNVFVDRA